MLSNLNTMVEESSDFIKNYFKLDSFDVGLITGTGITEFTDALDGKELRYEQIPNFPCVDHTKHKGSVIHAKIADKEVLFFNERLHYYQGHPIEYVGYPVRIMSQVGIKNLIMINSAATLTENMMPGDLMLIKDHINMMNVNPLVGYYNTNNENKFVNMKEPYSLRLMDMLKQTTDLNLKQGVYVGVSGPNFETPAEANYMRIIGGDAIGMSTVAETIVAHQCNIETIAISCISNYSSAIKNSRLSREKSIELAEIAEEKLVTAILNLIALI
ncbi:MAG: hypothetical protein A2015_14550 [Spirochaetes bacterium GWF1_31_7]|nr:MAG: hypothetical protein A2Y30_03205 [Spirochaetes bacterium GWE1_32_154]OHD50617.1 MAG: hypothetical protein A2015_14550 [Spirochaetes bacterium GWF1_31_7]OHD73844.1 MAG: hypothetical protein A2355_11800 [Spirochaetes bacterium RIFOXYB1_FULL_32_8]HBD92717.1 purine-nucleoside phosphorylase [Spirochaetia bacterium]HBI36500.1 purine-nucleoside phosphorylase [Spirochaetia bacterium]